jgi:hypothetical protein
MNGDGLEREPPAGGEARKETLAFAIELREQLHRDFALDGTAGSLRIYRRRGD